MNPDTCGYHGYVALNNLSYDSHLKTLQAADEIMSDAIKGKLDRDKFDELAKAIATEKYLLDWLYKYVEANCQEFAE